MLAVEIELLLGTYRADPSGDALTDRGMAEWPPAPARLLAALIAADGPSSREAPELEALAAARPPTIYADPSPHRQLLAGRYVVRSTREKGTHQEYPARKGALVRPGQRVSPRERRVVFLYTDFDPDASVLGALRHRAARVGYLGCADSPVAMTVDTVREPPTGPAFVPDTEGSVLINTHTAGQVAIWCAAYDAWAEQGINRRRFPALRHQTMYRIPGGGLKPETDGGRVVGWIRFARTVHGRRVASVAHAFKRAVYSRYKELHGSIPPPWFHGHGLSRSNGDWQLARFLPLPNVGNRYANGRIHGIAVWLPPDADDREARRIAEAVRSVTHLAGAVGGLVVADQGDRRKWVQATNRDRWSRPSRQWASAFPVVSDRHGPVQSIGTGDVARWCRQAGLPQPIAARVSRTPLMAGAVDLAQPETARPGHKQTRPWAHVEMFFEQKIGGPVVIGAARSYGLGLCAPVRETLGKVNRP